MNNADRSAMPFKTGPSEDARRQAKAIGVMLESTKYHTGLTKREHFAGLIMASIASTNRHVDIHAAESAVRWADALLKELDK